MPTHQHNPDNSAEPATNFEKTMHFPGSIVGNRYQIIQKLGRKETGKTFLAKDLQATVDGRCVVEQLNCKCDHEANWQTIQQHLFNEISVLKRLGDHPQIPQFYDYFAEGRQFYLIREYIDGDSLEQEIERKVFDEADTINLIQDTLRVLDFIHKTNVVHRNIQPINLIRRKQDNCYALINFGAVQELESTEINLQGELVFNGFVGNWSYIAPEQKTGTLHFSSDLYALAKTAVYALTGCSPQELEQTKINWFEQCQIGPKLKAILAKMMSPVVEQRYSSALEVLNDLRPLLKIGQTVGGRYLITRYLGSEAGIETYLADNLRRQYQSPCSIKQIELPHAGEDKIKLERRFAEELSVLERLGYYEQIPQLWDHFEENDEFYLVQEYIRGNNLAQKIAQQNLSTSEIVQLMVSALSVLKFVHQNRIIHRNIKPSSLIVREGNRVVLTDFGILADIKAASNNATAYSHKQDKQYWSPEQIAGRPTVSSDIYALGMTAIEALTKVKPDTFVRQQNGQLLWTENINLDRRLIRIIDRMVQLNLGQRYQSAEKVLSDLQKVNVNFIGQSENKSLQGAGTFEGVKSAKLPILVGLLGIACLLGSIEFAFPTIRPLYYWYRGQQLLPEQPQSALNKFTQAIDLKSQSWLAWSSRGDALSILERYPQALEAYAESTELNSNNAEGWKKQGNILYRLEKFNEAIAKYDRALELKPNDGEIYNLKGQALYRLQQYETALIVQKTALEQDRLNPQFLSDLAQNLRKLGLYSEALSVFNRVQATAPSNLKLWQDKFLVLEDLKRPQEAERVRREVSNNYTRIIQQQPQDESVWLAQGDFLVSAQMYPKAIDSYNRAIELKPNMYEALLGKAKALGKLAREQEALDTLDITLQIRPQSYLALQAKGNIYLNAANLPEAISYYDRAIEIEPNYAPLWRDRGLALNQQGKYTLASESLTTASELASYDPQTWLGLALAKDANGENQAALSAIDRAIDLEPQNPQLWHQKGLIYTKNGQYNEACETYRKSRRIITSDPADILSSMSRLGCRMN